jgi:hypothetical protein
MGHWRENKVGCAVRLRPDRGKLCSPVLPSAAQDDARHLGDPAYRSNRHLTPHNDMSAPVDDRQSPIWYGQRPQPLSSCPYGMPVCGTEPTDRSPWYDRRHAPPPRELPATKDRPCWSCHLGVCLHSGYYPDTFQPRRPAAYRWGSDSYQLQSPPISPPPYAAPLPESSPNAQLLLRKGASARQSPHSAARWSPRESRCVPVALGDEKALVRSETSPKSPLQLRDLRPQLSHGQLGHCGSIRRALHQSF